MEPVIGTIRKLDEKGFGFITADNFGANIFFHAKDMRRVRFEQLRVGDKVSVGSVFEKKRVDPKTGEEVIGYNARDVYLVS